MIMIDVTADMAAPAAIVIFGQAGPHQSAC